MNTETTQTTAESSSYNTEEPNLINNDNPDNEKDQNNTNGGNGEHRLRQYIEELENNNAEWKDRYLRLQAEFDNFRKRTIKEKQELEITVKEETIKTLLPMIDDLERALQVASQAENLESLKEGMGLMHKNVLNTLGKLGLKAIEAKGVAFDSDYHEAIAPIPVEDPELKGKVIDEAKKGYIFNEKVIRFAQVVVGE